MYNKDIKSKFNLLQNCFTGFLKRILCMFIKKIFLPEQKNGKNENSVVFNKI